MRQATAFIRQLGDPGRASACTRPTGTPAPPPNTPAAWPARPRPRAALTEYGKELASR